MNHSDMRILLRDAFARVFSREATQPELQCLQAVAKLESSYGDGWKPPGNGSNNYGAIQAGSSWSGATFQYTDTSPQPDGSNKSYVTKFRKYPTPIDGAIDLVKVVYQNRGRDKLALVPAGKGDTLGFSRGLHASGYYEGFGKTVDDRIANHHKAVANAIYEMADALHESLPADLASKPRPRPTLKLGARGESVAELQRLLNLRLMAEQLKLDGDFGAKTLARVKLFQGTAGLVADGVVGPATWAKLESMST